MAATPTVSGPVKTFARLERLVVVAESGEALTVDTKDILSGSLTVVARGRLPRLSHLIYLTFDCVVRLTGYNASSGEIFLMNLDLEVLLSFPWVAGASAFVAMWVDEVPHVFAYWKSSGAARLMRVEAEGREWRPVWATEEWPLGFTSVSPFSGDGLLPSLLASGPDSLSLRLASWSGTPGSEWTIADFPQVDVLGTFQPSTDSPMANPQVVPVSKGGFKSGSTLFHSMSEAGDVLSFLQVTWSGAATAPALSSTAVPSGSPTYVPPSWSGKSQSMIVLGGCLIPVANYHGLAQVVRTSSGFLRVKKTSWLVLRVLREGSAPLVLELESAFCSLSHIFWVPAFVEASPLQLRRWVPAAAAWKSEEGGSTTSGAATEGEGEVVVAEELTFITYNVWLNEFHMDERTRALIEVLQSHCATVVAMQEVTPRAYALLTSSPFVRDTYAVTALDDGLSGRRYGVVLLVRLPWASAFSLKFGSAQDRKALAVRLNAGRGLTFTVATSHLESLPRDLPHRATQIAMVGRALRHEENAIFCGDTNMAYDYEDETFSAALPGFQDAWPTLLGPDTKGSTFDSTNNAMTAANCSFDADLRLDRFFVKSPHFTIAAVEILGTQALEVPTAKEPVFISDHFGVFLRLKRKPPL